MMNKKFSIITFLLLLQAMLFAFQGVSYASTTKSLFKVKKQLTISRTDRCNYHTNIPIRQLSRENYIKIRYMKGQVHSALLSISIGRLNLHSIPEIKVLEQFAFFDPPVVSPYLFPIKGPPAING